MGSKSIHEHIQSVPELVAKTVRERKVHIKKQFRYSIAVSEMKAMRKASNPEEMKSSV